MLFTTYSQQETFIALDDAYVSQFEADTNFGADEQLLIKGSTDGTFNRKSYLKFDFSGISATYEQIVLKLVKSGGEELDSIQTSSTKSTWNESSITWNTTPDIEEALDIVQVRKGDTIFMDMTTYINLKLANNDFSLSTALSSDNNIGLPFSMYSKESLNNLIKPQLIFYETMTVDFSDDTNLSKYITSNMVIQRGHPFPFRGKGPANKTIVLDFEREGTIQTVSQLIDTNGNFNLSIPPMEATANSCTATISIVDFPDKTVILDNILIGDVWFAGGQSNMEYNVNHLLEAPTVNSDADNFPEIRAFRTRNNSVLDPVNQFKANNSPWVVCDSDQMNVVSGVAYIFAKEVHLNTGVPIGIMQSYLGGTEIETWLSEDKIENDPKLQFLENRLPDYSEDDIFLSNRYPSVNYNGMVHPLRFFPIKGFVFYQGESNVQRAPEYAVLMKSLIQDYRSKWNLGALPFYFVQLFNYGITSERNYEATPNENTWQQLRQQQYLVAEKSGLENIGMAISIETNEERLNPDENIRIHPRNKSPIGKRLAKLALKRVYNENIIAYSPVVDSIWAEEDVVYLRMKNVGTGLKVRDGEQELVGFAIGNSLSTYFEADATIEDVDLISVQSSQVSNPGFIAYGWSRDPLCTLDNSANLPASPFRLEIDEEKTFSTIDDAFVESGGMADNNFGNSINLEVADGTDIQQISYLKFDIRNLLFTTIDNAQVRLYAKTKEAITDIKMHKTSNSWSEDTIVFSSAPAVQEEISTKLIDETGVFYDFDVRDELIEAVENESFFFSVALENGSDAKVIFSSSESANNRPALVLNSDSTLSTKNPQAPISFFVFPNPASDGYINIYSKSLFNNKETKIYLTNLLGQTFQLKSIKSNGNYRINIGNLSAATYILTVEHKGIKYHKNLIVN